jgi:hypothetical protein
MARFPNLPVRLLDCPEALHKQELDHATTASSSASRAEARRAHSPPPAGPCEDLPQAIHHTERAARVANASILPRLPPGQGEEGAHDLGVRVEHLSGFVRDRAECVRSIPIPVA